MEMYTYIRALAHDSRIPLIDVNDVFRKQIGEQMRYTHNIHVHVCMYLRMYDVHTHTYTPTKTSPSLSASHMVQGGAPICHRNPETDPVRSCRICRWVATVPSRPHEKIRLRTNLLLAFSGFEVQGLGVQVEFRV